MVRIYTVILAFIINGCVMYQDKTCSVIENKDCYYSNVCKDGKKYKLYNNSLIQDGVCENE